MSKKKLLFLGILVLFCLFLVIFFSHWKFKEYYYRYKYDRDHSQKPIETVSEINKVLSQFETRPFAQLGKSYKTFTRSDKAKYKPLLKSKTYFVLTRDDFFKKIVGNFRVVDLLAKDSYYRKSFGNNSATYPWLMDKNLLYKILELQNELTIAGYNKRGFTITNGHRHPRYNEKVGGAKMSRHIQGEAIDIRINDIDNSGRYEQKDKDIVLGILEQKVIGNNGGIGRYPGTRAVHFDVRGYKARWDSY